MNETEVKARKHRHGYLYKRGTDGKQYKATSNVSGTYYLQYDLNGSRCRTVLRDEKNKPIHSLRKAETAREKIMAPLMVADEVEALDTIKQKLEASQVKLDDLKTAETPPLAINDAWGAYEKATNRPDTGDATMEEYRWQFGRFQRWMDNTHSEITVLRDVMPEIAAEYAAHLIKANLSSNTYNKHIRLLELVFRVLEDKADIAKNPWSKITRKKLRTNHRRELKVDELHKECSIAEGEMRTLFALGLYTGLRRGDCCTLRWAEVDLRRGVIIRIPNKTARSRAEPVRIPIHTVLAAILDETPRKKRAEYVMPQMAQDYEDRRYCLTKRIQKHFKDCGIRTQKKGTGHKVEIEKDGKERKVHTGNRAVVEVGFHSFRHSFVSLCRESNAPLAVVEAIVGHSNPAMTQHYTHVGDLAASQAVAALPALLVPPKSGEGGNNAEGPAILESDVKVPREIPVQSENVSGSPSIDIMAELRKMNSKNWKKVRDRLVRELKADN